MTETTVVDLASTVLDPNARTVLAAVGEGSHTPQAIYRRLRARYGDTVTGRLVRRALDRLEIAGCVEKTTWFMVDDVSTTLVEYRLRAATAPNACAN